MTADEQPTQVHIDLHNGERITVSLTDDRDRDEMTQLVDDWQAGDLAHGPSSYETVTICGVNRTTGFRWRDIRQITFH